MSLSSETLVRQRAYEIWESENRPHGRDKEHWERALREISAAATSAAAKPAAKATARSTEPSIGKKRGNAKAGPGGGGQAPQARRPRPPGTAVIASARPAHQGRQFGVSTASAKKPMLPFASAG